MKKEDLVQLCYERGIHLNTREGYKTVKEFCAESNSVIKKKVKVMKIVETIPQLEHLLGSWFYNNNFREKTWGLTKALQLQIPMLCARLIKQKEEIQKEVMRSNSDWFAEQKWNGARMRIFYHPNEGFSFFSRGLATEDFLPIEYTETISFIHNGITREPESLKNFFKKPFILDSEIITEVKELNTKLHREYGVETNSELNAVSALLQISPEESKKLQHEAPLKFKVFDIIHFDGKDLLETPLQERKKLQEALVDFLNNEVGLPFENSLTTYINKQELFDNVLSNGGEGIVLKNKNSIYDIAGKRPNDGWLKLKKSMNASLGDSIDAFITGFWPGNPGTNIEHMIGCLEFSVNLVDANGLREQHVIANISGLSMELREKMTELDHEGKVNLKQEWYGKVFEIDGHSVSGQQMRLTHAKLKTGIPREDKKAVNCEQNKEELLKHIL